jgi:exopolysaccharide biosynthesis polyprenyl glycosylphosphotransferase
MNSNGILQQHWLRVSLHFLIDSMIFIGSFVAAFQVRFGDEGDAAFDTQWPFLLIGANLFSCATYILRMYSPPMRRQGRLQAVLSLLVATLLGLTTVLVLSYFFYAHTLGRGVILLGGSTALIAATLHHALLRHNLRNNSDRVAFLVGRPIDEAQTHLIQELDCRHLRFAGIVLMHGYKPESDLPVLGHIDDLEEIIENLKLDRLLCSEQSLLNPGLSSRFCQLRYSGVTIMSLVTLCEELDQCVPLELLTPQWLLHASGEPHVLYIQKVKRLFDIAVSAIGIVISSPFLLLGAIAVKISSPGPIFYRQTRSGRFGRNFQITKLRTMRTDAEKDGAVWCSLKGDPRITAVGHFLRRYRIDEIPQLLHVFSGEMSFVGPRPERPEMIKKLAKEIPFYKERLMVQPGITGWAQVNYPYGASTEDAARKLEYDLYYMKHMSLFLDLFILLDTVRTVVSGGIRERGERERPNYRSVAEVAHVVAGISLAVSDEASEMPVLSGVNGGTGLHAWGASPDPS